MNMMAARVMALCVTATSLLMAGSAGWDRGSSPFDRTLWASILVLIAAGSHLIPSIAKSRIAWSLWACCFLGALYSHMTFFSFTALLAGEYRSEHSLQLTMVEQEITTARQELGAITSRPVTAVAAQLAVTKSWRTRKALLAELSEAKRAEGLRDRIAGLQATARVTQVTGATDPVTTGIARVMGSNSQTIQICTALGFAILLEFLGAFLWYQVTLDRDDLERLKTDQFAENECSTVRREIAAGHIKPTVQAIREFLHCSQATAMEVRRKVVPESS